MLDSSDQQRLHKLLSDTIPLLCKRSLGYSSELSVEAFIGITLSDENASSEVVMVSFKETLLADGRISSYVWSELPSSSTDDAPSLIEPVASSVSELGGCDHQSSQKVDSVDGHDSRLERHDECEPDWDDDRYWAGGDEAMINGTGKVAPGSSTSIHLLSFPVKMEENDDIAKIDDDPEDLAVDAELETTSYTGNSYGYKNPYSSVVHHYSSARCPRGTVKTRPHCLSSESRRLLKSSKVSRKTVHQRVSAQPLSYQRLPSSSYSKPHAKMKGKLPAMNTAVHSSQSEHVVQNWNGEASLPQYTMFDGVHKPILIAPTPMQTAPKKRCRVCYAAKTRREVRFCCGTCPERPGLCLKPCFMEFHRSMVSVTSPAFIFSGVEPSESVKSPQWPDSAHGH